MVNVVLSCEVKMKRRARVLWTAGALAALICAAGAQGSRALADEVKVGVLHSLTGTMAISEVTVKNATMLAIDQINAIAVTSALARHQRGTNSPDHSA
jgi:hypothetical protein